MKTTLPLLGLSLMAAIGCVHHHETVYRDVPRVKVSFENDTAGRLFYEALSRAPKHQGRESSKTKVQIPLVFSHSVETVTDGNTAFNQAVQECDTNQDRRITETEARIFWELK